METTRVVHHRNEPYDILITRDTEWGNPFVIGIDGTRTECIEKYEDYLLHNEKLLSKIMDLDGKILGCWCKPRTCHGDVIVETIERIKKLKLWQGLS